MGREDKERGDYRRDEITGESREEITEESRE